MDFSKVLQASVREKVAWSSLPKSRSAESPDIRPQEKAEARYPPAAEQRPHPECGSTIALPERRRFERTHESEAWKLSPQTVDGAGQREVSKCTGHSEPEIARRVPMVHDG